MRFGVAIPPSTDSSWPPRIGRALLRCAASSNRWDVARRRSLGHIAGCMLYWAEGSKSRNSIQFVNSDPAMVRFCRVPAPGIRRSGRALSARLQSVRRPRRAAKRDRAVLARHCRLTRLVSPKVDGQRLLEVQPEEAPEPASLRNRSRVRALDADRPEHLRLDPGVRLLRPAGMARLKRRLVGRRAE